MKRIIILIAVCLACNAYGKGKVPAGEQSSPAAGSNTILLEALDMSKCASLTNIHPTPIDYGFKMNIATPRSYQGGIFLNGVQTLTESAIYIALDGKTLSFSADVGIDMLSPDATAEFSVVGDGRILWQSGVMKSVDPERPVRVDLKGVKSLILKTGSAQGQVYTDWVNAVFRYDGEVPRTEWSPEIREIIRDTKAFMEEQNKKYPAPRINGAMKVGIRPNTPFYYPVAVTGMRPVTFQVESLPEGLKIDLQTGIISGTPVKRGEYDVRITAANTSGKSQRTLKIVVGDQLCLTPPMGYLSWNWIEGHVSEISMKEIGDALVEFGFRDAGYQFVEADDGWEGLIRGADGRITSHPYRFPDGMKSLGDHLHAQGLKLGIYSSPGALTCGSYPGSLGFEALDVDTWVSWGVDLLKYDHCSCPVEGERTFELASLMGDLLKKSGRSIVMEYGYNELGGRDAGNHYFHTGGDVRDTWSNAGYTCYGMGILEIFNKAVEYADAQSPGRWVYPDMLLAGLYGTGRAAAICTDGKGCTDTEYRSQMSLWALMSSPLVMSCDIRRVNRATLATLTNPEVIEVNQDPVVMQQKIRAAATHGIDVFIFDWYTYLGRPFLNRCIDEGFLKARNTDSIKFALMWANHDWMELYPYTAGDRHDYLYSGKVTPAMFDLIGDSIVKQYFTRPNYWLIDGKAYFSVYDIQNFINSFGSLEATRQAMDRLNEKAVRAGLKGVHWNLVAWGTAILPGQDAPADNRELLEKLKFDSATSYVWIHHVELQQVQTDYNLVRDGYMAHWDKAREEYGTPYYPNVTMGWDPSPRTDQDKEWSGSGYGYPYTNTIGNNTPENFKTALQMTRDRLLADPSGPRIMNINCWNEWTEGSYLEPDIKTGMAYLEAVKDVFK